MSYLVGTLIAVITVFAFSQPSVARENELESWYTYWGFGASDNDLFDDVDLEGTGVSHTSLSVDSFGFYWPRGQKTLVGGVINTFADFFEGNDLLSSAEINSYNSLYSISAMHFLSPKIGQGFFVRADAGLALHYAEVKLDILGNEADSEWTSEWGSGFLIGGGYGFPITSGTRLLLNANVSQRYVEEESMTNVGITLNGLF